MRRQRIVRRTAPLLLLALAAFAGGVVTGTRSDPPGPGLAERYAVAWTRGNLKAMHAQLAPSSQRRFPLARFERLHRAAAATATTARIERAGRVTAAQDAVQIPLRAQTKLFGPLDGTLSMAVRTEGEVTGLVWERHLVLPGLRRGDRLRRDLTAPPRADLQARDGTLLASGTPRTTTAAAAGGVAGTVGPIPGEQAGEYARRGYPEDAQVGLSGLEREFEARLAGRFGGLLRASGRLLARAEAQRGEPVRASISPRVQAAAVAALGPRLGGIAVLQPQTGEVLALAGIAYSALQPPGSTFKVITLAAGLEQRAVRVRDRFPVVTAATLEGVEVENANGESCGGTLTESFAESCNSVFAPLGVRLGAQKLVAAAEAFGFNEPPSLQGAQTPVIPDAEEIGDDLALGSTAIGQGLVQSTPLHLAGVAATIANRGEYVRPTLLKGARGRRSRAVSARTAATVGRMMQAVVTSGTGVAAQIEGVSVAGKTGTAELRDSTPDPEAPEEVTQALEDDVTDTDAWFLAYAPARRPRIAIGVLLVGAGAGGATAAPAAREVLLAALRRR